MADIKKLKVKKEEVKKADIVLQSNQFINAIHNITVSESRIIEMAIVDARETSTGLSTDKPLRVYVKDYADRFNIEWQSAYEAMLAGTKTLKRKGYEYPHPKYPDDPKKNVQTNYLQDFAPIHDEGYFELTFTRSVVDEISRIDGKKMPYTTYFLRQTAKMTSIYAIRLFQMLSTWRRTLADTGEPTPIYELCLFRLQLGVQPEDYERIYDFKKKVLDVAKKQINKHTDMTIDYEQIKRGRDIVGFKFIMTNDKDEMLNVSPVQDSSSKRFVYSFRTDKQRDYVASLLSVIHSVVGDSSWRTSQEAATAISEDLKDPMKQSRYIPFIEKLDVKIKKIEC